MKKSKRRRWLIVLFVVPVVLVMAFVIWARFVPEPMPEALRALQSDDKVTVDTASWITFRPAGQTPAVGFIFYPGGRVDFRSYAPAARAIASAGYLVVMVPMPLNLAVLAPDRALEVQKAFPNVRQWVIGGHSLGGAMAARFAFKHPETVQGLVMWAAYPPSSANLSNRTIEAVSISGTLDGLATPEKIQSSHSLLPSTTRWVALEGGNHAQFGWYGPQSGDRPATLIRAEQQAQIVAATLELLRSLEVQKGMP